jgi:hypothetical protein
MLRSVDSREVLLDRRHDPPLLGERRQWHLRFCNVLALQVVDVRSAGKTRPSATNYR